MLPPFLSPVAHMYSLNMYFFLPIYPSILSLVPLSCNKKVCILFSSGSGGGVGAGARYKANKRRCLSFL